MLSLYVQTKEIVMKIISSTQLKELDKYTIAKEPVASIDLMERQPKNWLVPLPTDGILLSIL